MDEYYINKNLKEYNLDTLYEKILTYFIYNF